MTDMIERVARAIHDNPPGETRMFEAEGIVVTRDYSVTARAVLKAMQEPTDTMVVKGDEEILAHLNDKNRFLKTAETPASDSWRSMIDAALKPETIERSER